MSESHCVVVDATLGAGEGWIALRAAATASLDLNQDVVVVGDESQITAALAGIAHDAERLRVVHAPDSLSEDVPSRRVLDEAPRSAIPVGLSLVASRPTYSFVTAGRPGAVVSASETLLERLPGVRRPALAAVLPTLRFRGEHDDPFALILDVGAHAHAESADLISFARMGVDYARAVSANERPRVGLLSHTRDPTAAPRSVAAAHVALSESTSGFEYIGLMGADQISLGDADVVVAEGLSGNVVVRTLEGVAASAGKLLERARSRFRWRVGTQMLGSGLDRLRALTDWENYGGAPLLGFDRTVIVTHEEAGEHALLNAIRLAAKVERLGLHGPSNR